MLEESPLQIPKFGKIVRINAFESKFVTPRNIEIWLPDHFKNDGSFAVVYIHDGQMLFDERTTWNNTAWNVDQIAQPLMDGKLVRDFVIVGIWNGGESRHKDYFPEKPYNLLNSTEKTRIDQMLIEAGKIKDHFVPNSDNYLKCLIAEIIPYIESQFKLKEGKENRFVAGSSMGGLISWYALMEYPEYFGGSASLSIHWPGSFTTDNNPFPEATLKYLNAALKGLKGNKIYFDYGDDNLDRLYPPLQEQINKVMLKYPLELWRALRFRGQGHNEKAWHDRFHIPLLYLLGN